MGSVIQASEFGVIGGSQQGRFWEEKKLSKRFQEECWHDHELRS
jgi:hypothetical protein